MTEFSVAIRTRPVPNGLLLSILACAGCWVEDLRAATLDYSLGYRAEYRDNVTLVPSERDGLSELINTLSAQVSFLENTSTIDARIQASVAYNHFYNGTFDNQTTFSLDAYGESFFLERTLSWVAADGFRRLQIDPLLPDTPINRRNSNAWATGPNAYLRLGAVDTVMLQARYGRSWVENLELDSNRHSYATRWAHRTSPRVTWSLNYEYLNIDYENDTLNSDLSRHNYFLRADMRDTRSQFTVDLGRSGIEREGSGSDSNMLVHLVLSRQTGMNVFAGATYRREYSDTGSELLRPAITEPAVGTGAGASIPALGADVVTNEPYYLQQTDLFFARRGGTFPWQLQVYYRDIDYPLLPRDRQEKGVSLDVNYLYSSSISVQLLSTYSILSYDQLEREDRESNAGVILAYRMTPGLRVGLEYRRFGRRSTAANQDYTDDRFALTLLYGSRPAGR